tara:strand:- start:834 stop:1742 length:909 start_codon:yes stop_codon:yes gene_type:complete
MAYSPGTIASGTTVTQTIIEDRVDNFRKELNPGGLSNDSITAGAVTKSNVVNPELEQISGREWEWRGESGGVHYFTKDVANLVCVEHLSVLDSGTKGDNNFQLPPPSGKPENGGVNTILHKFADASDQYSKMIPVPDCGVTVRLNALCDVEVRVKTIFNNLLNNTITNSLTGFNYQLGFVGEASPSSTDPYQFGRLFLLHRDPSGTVDLMGVGYNGVGWRQGNLIPTQHHLMFRDNHMMGRLRITSTSQFGEHSFFLVALMRKEAGPASLQGGSIWNKQPIHIGLQGRTEFQVEWYNVGAGT